jgi:WS/DGAT/MGAT family acyltransferase
MKTLSGLDATFLYLETPETPMHVGSLHLYELPPDFKGSFHKAVQAHIARRMHLAPIFSRQLAAMPLDLGHPGWVQADTVDLKYHIRKVKGRAMSLREVEAEAGRLHGQLMDRSRPLWEFHVFDSVKPLPGQIHAGKLVAFYSKVHHAALDGKGGTLLANAILDLSAIPREVPPPDKTRRRTRQSDLKTRTLLGGVLSNSLAQYIKLAKALPSAASSLGSMARQAFGESDAGSDTPATKGKTGIRSPIRLAPRTLFNVAVSTERSLATVSLPFAECKTLAHAVGGSFNDLVMWLCATALRSYLAGHGGIPEKSLVAAMPVSLREDGNLELNTQASMALVDLGTQLADPLMRMQAIQTSTAKVKHAMSALKTVLPTDYPSLLAPWVVGGVAKAAYKLYSATGLDKRLPMLSNVVISNVPGPQVPLYLAGARMLTYHPLSIVTHSMALNITIQTYAGSVDFGLVADRHAVPDLQDLADALRQAFEEARQLPALAPAQPAQDAPKPARAPRTPRARPAPAVPPPVETPATVVTKATKTRRAKPESVDTPSGESAKSATVRKRTTARKQS